MTRLQPLAAGPWPLRWLLVMLTLAGLGIWQGGHCADDMAADTGAAFAVTVGDVAVQHTAGAASPKSVDGLGDDHGPARPHGPGSTADDCDVVPATTVSTTATGSVSLAAGVRTAVIAPRRQPLRHRLLPAVALTHLSISRT